jgi:hypothetical protein
VPWYDTENRLSLRLVEDVANGKYKSLDEAKGGKQAGEQG